jgi:EAL domain-containing protein (putative c-di-GMP-specific phosphodiesterase class I)
LVATSSPWRIAEALRSPVPLRGREVILGASVGVAHACGGERVEELLRNADVTMYKAKDDGKGRHVLFEPGMHAALLDRLELEADLRHAVERGEIQVVYQPIVELESGSITSVEALARWKRSGQEMPASASFIPVAEETGLIVPIGRYVHAEACRQGREWQLAAMDGVAPTMSVNVSARQLQDASFTSDVRAILAESQFPADRLILEITESVLVSNTAAARDRLFELKSLGVRLAIDDFGTGYCNLSYLQRFPIDILKIDRSFITHMAKNDGDAALASSIVGLAMTLKLQTVAEGIEHADQRAQLIALGCSHGQGFLFARPVAPDVVHALIQSGGAGPAPALETTAAA